MAADEFDEWGDGPRMEKLRHNRKYQGHGGPPHKPWRGMVNGHTVGIRQVMDVVRAEQRRANKQANKAKALDDDMRAISKRQHREAQQ
jgi:hypothetical protein